MKQPLWQQMQRLHLFQPVLQQLCDPLAVRQKLSRHAHGVDAARLDGDGRRPPASMRPAHTTGMSTASRDVRPRPPGCSSAACTWAGGTSTRSRRCRCPRPACRSPRPAGTLRPDRPSVQVAAHLLVLLAGHRAVAEVLHLGDGRCNAWRRGSPGRRRP